MQVIKRMRLFNSGRKKKLTAKQKLFFGTKRQRTMLLNSRKRRKNIGEIITLDINPRRKRRVNSGRLKRGNMARRKVKKTKAATAARRRYHRLKFGNSGVRRRRRWNAGVGRIPL